MNWKYSATLCLALLGSPAFAADLPPQRRYACLPTFEHESPVGGGVQSVTLARGTGNVPFMKASFNRGSGWLDDTLNWITFPDGYNGPFPITNRQFFSGIPGRTFWARFGGGWSDNNELKPFRIEKRCTPNVTQIIGWNAYDSYPNVIITITWDRPYSLRSGDRLLTRADLRRMAAPRGRSRGSR